MQDQDAAALVAAIAALESQRVTLGEAVLALAVAPLRARLAGLQRRVPGSGLQLRQVSVLFADVVGSTAISGSLDAEATLDVLGGALRRMAEVVEAHGGRVLRFTGDGVKAAFGMDEAREDDPERAVRAGLAILHVGRELADAARLADGVADFAVRVGVHTGDVALGAGVEADNTAMGAAVNIAARMEQTAPPGGLRISHDTWSHVRGLFDAEAQPLLQVKGVAAPMSTYLVSAALDRSKASVERGLQGLRTPMVGRNAELQLLLDAVERAGDTQQLQALTLIGDAGLGKSRLLREWLAALSVESSRCHLLVVRAQPDGMLRPWGLLRSLLAVQFGVADTDSAELARHKVEHGLSPWLDERGEDQAKRQAQLIGQLSGLDFCDSPHVRGLDPRSLRDQAFAAFLSYLLALASRSGAPPLLVVEDLHWADDGSLDLLQHLLSHAADLPLALVMTGRPALLARRPDWCTAHTMVPLTPLEPAQSDALAQALLQRLHVVPAPLAELVVGRAEGNPYYMEELVRRLIDDGVIEVGEAQWTAHVERLKTLRLPGTLVGLLQARLDSLPPGERMAVRHASVIGHVFWDDALQAVNSEAPRALPALQQAAFVKAHSSSDFEGTRERQFDHHLLHQVIYDTLLKAERRLGHSAVARWLVERTQGRGAEFLAMTGGHAERAGDTALAIDCFEQAGNEARQRFANTAAQAFFQHTLDMLAASDPPRRYRVLKQLDAIADIVGDRAAQDTVHAAMALLLEQHPDDRLKADLLWTQALLADRRSNNVAAEQLSRQAIDLAQRSGAAETAALSHGMLAWLAYLRDDHACANDHLKQGLQWAALIEPGATNPQSATEAQLMTLSAIVLIELRRFDAARDMLEAVLSRGEELGRPRVRLGALDHLCEIEINQGRWQEVASRAEQMRILADAGGFQIHLSGALKRLGLVAHAAGQPAAAQRPLRQALDIARRTENRKNESQILRALGICCLEVSDFADAARCFADAKTLYRTLGEPGNEMLATVYGAWTDLRGNPRANVLPIVDTVLARLDSEFADEAPHETLHTRWICRHVLDALGDTRAAPLLTHLHADVQARAAELTDAADRERLIQALPLFREIVVAYRKHGRADASP
jgi:class 3 adenylate cyclase/tetratricopeptide (TPR) repeat protein